MENEQNDVAAQVGKRLLEIRGDRSQREMGDEVGIALQTWARYERGERLPDPEVLIALGQRGVDLNWLMGGRGARSDGKPFITALGREKLSAEFVLVPRYNIKFEGGEGLDIFTDEAVVSEIAFRRDWLEAEGILDDPLGVCDSDGDSMYPTIPRDYIVLINRRFRSFSGPGIYALQAFGRHIIKRLDMNPATGDLSLISDNKDKYPERIVPADLLGDLHFIGRAVWWAPGHADM